jgi:UPF0755 protein
MSPLFGRSGGGGDDDSGPRSAAQREQDRLDRERRRAEREGREPPQDLPPLVEPPPDLAAPGPDPASSEPPAPDPPTPAKPAPAAEPQGEPDWLSEPPGSGTAPLSWDNESPTVTVRRGSEEPLGTKRVAASQVATAAGADAPPRFGAPPRGRPRSRRGFRRVGPIAGLLIVVVGLWFLYSLIQPFKGDGHGSVVVKVPSGANASDIGKLLADKHVVSSKFFFELRARLSGDRGNLRAGSYTLKQDMSYGAVLTALTTKPKTATTVKVTIPEGRSIRETIPLVRSAGLRGGYLKAAKSKALLKRVGAPRATKTLEGYLFPSTYELRAGAPAAKLVSEQVSVFTRNLASVDLRAAHKKNLTTYDVLTIASMIDREAAVPGDRAKIAAVIYNRLHDKMPLGIDATIRYSLNDWTRPLKVSELQRDTPYNTRVRQGLPPTPIGSPGLASIQAAAKPAKVNYLYYVVKPCGNGAHAFSSTDAQFQHDVAAYNAARAKRGGKDPSHC